MIDADLAHTIHQLAQDNRRLAEQLKQMSGILKQTSTIVWELSTACLHQLEMIAILKQRIESLEQRVNQ